MRFVARDRPSDELTLGKMAGLTEISAMGSFDALAIVVVFVLAAVVVITFVLSCPRFQPPVGVAVKPSFARKIIIPANRCVPGGSPRYL